MPDIALSSPVKDYKLPNYSSGSDNESHNVSKHHARIATSDKDWDDEEENRSLSQEGIRILCSCN